MNMTRSQAGLAAALLLALVGCGGGADELSASEDRRFRAAIEQDAGSPVADWPAFVEIGRDVCDDDEETFALDVATFADQGDIGQLRLIVKHLCPDRAEELADAEADVAAVQEACDAPAADRTSRQRELAEAKGC
jgi:hypothetical protein